jgi:hypothetical protein
MTTRLACKKTCKENKLPAKRKRGGTDLLNNDNNYCKKDTNYFDYARACVLNVADADASYN